MARKFFGLPASRDVGILSKLLSLLREQAEERLGRKVGSAVVTSPNLVALYAEDITDAMEYTGLKPPYLKGSSDLEQPRENSAAQAGYGVGLCSHYKDYDQCESEEDQMPVRRVLTVLFTRSALALYEAAYKGALSFHGPSYHGRSDFLLGSDAIHTNPKEEYYWEDVRNRVMEVLLRYGGERYPVTQVSMLGESALNPRLLEVVNSSISAIYEEQPEFLLSDPIFAAAKGAAEFAIRAPWSRPTHWVNRANVEQIGGTDL
jgi:hypothetical protein